MLGVRHDVISSWLLSDSNFSLSDCTNLPMQRNTVVLVVVVVKLLCAIYVILFV